MLESPVSPLLDGGLPALLRHEICRKLLQTVHEWRTREFFRTNDEGIAAHKEPCFLCGHEGSLLRSHLYIRDDIRACRASQWIVQRSTLS